MPIDELVEQLKGIEEADEQKKVAVETLELVEAEKPVATDEHEVAAITESALPVETSKPVSSKKMPSIHVSSKDIVEGEEI